MQRIIAPLSRIAARALAAIALACLAIQVLAAPSLVTKKLPDAFAGKDYSARIMVSSQLPVSILIGNLPPGLSATHNGTGTIEVTGMPTGSSDVQLSLNATDAQGTATLSVPLKVRRNSRLVSSVAAGEYHTCIALRGGVSCWGRNYSGQLGNGTSVDSLTPVMAMAEGSGATAVVAGEVHTCALVSGGVMCWGLNNKGQIGNNQSVDAWSPVWTIPANSGVTMLSSRVSTNCAVRSAGLQCWGDSGYGQAATGRSTIVTVPTWIVTPGSGVSGVSSGGLHTCALIADGVRCWGQNSSGQTGHPDVSPTLTGYPVIATGGGVTSIGLGSQHSCAVVKGSAMCWGRNGPYGAFADPGFPYSTPVPTTLIASGALHINGDQDGTCVAVSDGLRCWGKDFESGGSPIISVGGPPSVLSTGLNHSCLVLDGETQCWGAGNGRLGGDDGRYVSSPVVVVATGEGATGISSSGGLSCASVSGGVSCWGYGAFSPPGGPYRNYGKAWKPVQVAPMGAAINNVSVGPYTGGSVCAYGDSQAICLGDNGAGQLGVGNASKYTQPVSPLLPVGATIRSLSQTNAVTCAVVNSDGYCWGASAYGMTASPPGLAVTIPTKVTVAFGSFAKFGAGYNHMCALFNGGVKCWGDNFFGQLGPSDPLVFPYQAVAPGDGATDVAANLAYSCAVVSGGMRCWGQFPGKDRVFSGQQVVQVLPANGGVASVSAGGSHVCFLQTGSAKCWGRNSEGQLGTGDWIDHGMPSDAVTVIESASAVAAGAYQSCAVVNGGIACWGLNTWGESGAPYATAVSRVISDVPFVGRTAAIALSGSGAVRTADRQVRCAVSCSVELEHGSAPRLIAEPSVGFAFQGWSGGNCAGTGSCVVNADSNPAVTAVFVPMVTLNVDASTAGPGARALSDGGLVVRYMQGLTGNALVAGLGAPGASRTAPGDVLATLDAMRYQFDVDGDGLINPATDGVLLLRYLMGFRGVSLSNGAIGSGATRVDAAAIEQYLAGMIGP